MGEDTLLNLRWDAQRSAILSSVAEIFREESFIDITIVSDEQIFKAHRLILAASSPYLKHALLTVPSEHAVLLLPHISSADLGNILKFIYEGEIKINQKALKSFLQVAKLLKIKGMDFDTDLELPEVTAAVNSKRSSPVILEEDSAKRLKLNSNADAQSTFPVMPASPSNINSTSTTLAAHDNHRERDHEHIPSSTADFQIQPYHGDNPRTSSITSCEREDDSDVKSEHDHLDYDKELISLDEDEDDGIPIGDADIEYDHDEEDEDVGFPFQPEVSFQEGTWGVPHSSTSSSSSLQHSGDFRRLRPAMSSTGIGSGNKHSGMGMGKSGIGIGEGILQRMMREPLKSTGSHHGGQSMSISLSHGVSQGHVLGHSLSPYDLHDASNDPSPGPLPPPPANESETQIDCDPLPLAIPLPPMPKPLLTEIICGRMKNGEMCSGTMKLMWRRSKNPHQPVPIKYLRCTKSGCQTHRGLRKQTKRYVQCTSCSKVLSSLSALKRHMEDVHCARIQGKCIICGRVYSSRNSLLTHVYSAHKKHHDYKAVARIIRESDFEQFANV